MGCDIHMYIQYRDKESINTKYSHWRDFGGRLNPGRNYTMFSTLAMGVRGEAVKGFEPKGVPDFGLSWGIESELTLFITSDGQEDGCCTLENAKRWGGIINDSEGNPSRVRQPDWHTHSWLTTKELAQAYKWYKKESEYDVGLEYRVLLKIMKELEDKGKNEVIVVFWFDN